MGYILCRNSYVELRHNSSGKLATTSSGVAITGNIDVSGNILTANASGLVSDANARILTGTGGGTWQAYAGASNNSAFLINNSAGATKWNFDLGGTGITQVSNNVVPNGGGVYNLGDDVNRWRFVFCNILDSAGLHEQNLQDEEQPIGQYETGTVLTWRDGKNRPCTRYADHMRMGIAVKGQDSPLVQGAEPVLCTGKVEEGDYLVTSRKEGHAEAVSRHIVMQQMLWDCVIGKALENSEGESHLVKTWVNI